MFIGTQFSNLYTAVDTPVCKAGGGIQSSPLILPDAVIPVTAVKKKKLRSL
jgi:hypothetical protein